MALSWESQSHPERKAWSTKLQALIATYQAQLEEGNPDGFIAGYNGLSAALKKKFWAELVIAMSKYESGWDPKQVYHEPPPLGVNSIGLLQLSLHDGANYGLQPKLTSENKLKDAEINLEWGVQILAALLERDKVVATSKNNKHRGGAAYWSVLRAGHKIDQIIALVKTNIPV